MATVGTGRTSDRLALKRKVREERGSQEDSDFVDPFTLVGDNASVEQNLQTSPVKRGRGRPPKHSYAVTPKAQIGSVIQQDTPQTASRPQALASEPMVHIVTVASSDKKSKRGRPRKYPPPIYQLSSADGSSQVRNNSMGSIVPLVDGTSHADMSQRIENNVAQVTVNEEEQQEEEGETEIPGLHLLVKESISEESSAEYLQAASQLEEKGAARDRSSQIFPVAYVPISLKCLDSYSSDQMALWHSILKKYNITLEDSNGHIFAKGQIEYFYKAQKELNKMNQEDSTADDITEEQGAEEEGDEDEEVNEGEAVSDEEWSAHREVKPRHYKRRLKKCDMCDFRSTTEGLKRHKWRQHPEKVISCEICGMNFGVEYDMRRHRLTHFDATGKLTSQGASLLEKYDPSRSGLSLCDLEKEFVPVDSSTILTAVSKQADPLVKTETTDAVDTEAGTPTEELEEPKPSAESNTEQSVPTQITKNLNVSGVRNTKVQCGLCPAQMTLSSIRFHRQYHAKVLYMCPVVDCEYMDSKQKTLELHYMNKHHDLSLKSKLDYTTLPCKCAECEFQGNRDEVTDHTEKNHTFTLKCIECDSSFLTDADFRLHYINVHSKKVPSMDDVKLRLPPRKKGVTYQCNDCGRTFQHLMHYNKHLSSHKNALYRCELCPFTADKLGLVNHHIRQKHARPEETTCNQCHKVFSTPATLLYHVQTVHDKSSEYTCDECGKGFTSKKYLQVHMNRMHLKKLNHYCRHCGKGFFEKQRRDEHEQVHATGEEKEALKTHTCSYCGKRFGRRLLLTQHENTHTGRRPFKCKICGKGFAYSAEVSKHLMVHRDERPYVCSFCGKGFKFSYKLKAHLTIHTKQGGHPCTKCGKVFTANSSLKKHACKAVPRPASVDLPTTKLVFATSSVDQARQFQDVIVNQEGLVTAEDAEVVENALHVTTTSNNKDLLIEKILSLVSQSDRDPQDTVVHGDELLEQDTEAAEQAEPDREGDGQVLYMCGICNNMFPSEEEVNAHMVEHDIVTMVMKEEEEETEINEGVDDQLGQHHVVVTQDGLELEEEVTSVDLPQEVIMQEGGAQEIIVNTEDVEGAAIALTHLLG